MFCMTRIYFLIQIRYYAETAIQFDCQASIQQVVAKPLAALKGINEILNQ